MSKPLPPVLTSYDFLKATALILMVVDHVGYYFYPEDMWFRIVGRFSAPIWLFLVGYARSRDLSPRMWIGAIILVVANYVVGMAILPLNILFTSLFCRMALDPVMDVVRRNPKALYPIATVLFFLTLAAFAVFEYGTAALLIVMTGYMVRNREGLGMSKNDLTQFAGVAALMYACIEVFTFMQYGKYAMMSVAIGLLVLVLFLLKFRPYEYPEITQTLPKPVAGLIRLMGRRTLEFYVLHLVLFKAAVLFMGSHGTSLFNFHIF
jgi:hypothetical protein